MRMSKRQVTRALTAARRKAAEDRLREKQKNKEDDDERIMKQIEDLEKVFKVINCSGGGDSA